MSYHYKTSGYSRNKGRENKRSLGPTPNDMGTGRGYTPSRSYSYQGGNYGLGSTNYGGTTNYEPSQRRYSSSYESPQRRYSFSGDGKTPTIKDRFSFWAAIDKGHNSSLDRSYGNKDRYSSLDRYSTKSASSDPYGRNSGYMSDFGGSVKSYNSYDRGSLRSGRSYGNMSEREGSPYSSRSSRYDYGSSVSPYSTYNSKNDKPQIKRSYSYERPTTNDYSKPISRPTSSKSIPYSVNKSPADTKDIYKMNQRNARKRRGDLSSSDSDDSAPEADKADPTVKYLMCRGTLPIGQDDSKRSKKDNDKEKKRISRTKRIRVHRKDIRVDRYGRVVPTNLPKPMLVDCSVQTNLERESRRERIMAMAAEALTPGKSASTQATFKQFKNRFLETAKEPEQVPPPRKKRDEEKRRRNVPDGSTSDALGHERSWRQSVYGEPPPSRRSGGSRPLSYADDTETDMSVVDDDRSRRRDRHSRRDREAEAEKSQYSAAEDTHSRSHRSRGSGVKRSNSREDMLDDRSTRQERRSKADLTPETLSMKESIDKVQKWKQHLPAPAMDFGTDYTKAPQRPSTSSSRSSRQAEREPSPDRGRHRSGASDARRSKQSSRHGSDESLYTKEEQMIGRDPLLPNKDFRKSSLNKAAEQREKQRRHIEQLQKPFERDQSPNESRSRSSRQGEHHSRQSGKGSKRNSGSSSDAFSRDGSPNARYMPSRQASDQRSIRRDSSREDVLDDRSSSRQRNSGGSKYSRRDTYEDDHGFSHEGSPNRGHRGSSRQSAADDSRRHERRSNRYDSDREYDVREGRPYPGRHNEYYRQQPQEESRRGRMKSSASTNSMASNASGSLPDLVPGADHILDAPVPRTGHPPLEPQSSIEEKRIEREQRREALGAMMKKIEENKRNKPKVTAGRSMAFGVFSQKTAQEEEQKQREIEMEERKRKRAEALAAKQAALEEERQKQVQQQRLIEFDSPASDQNVNDPLQTESRQMRVPQHRSYQEKQQKQQQSQPTSPQEQQQTKQKLPGLSAWQQKTQQEQPQQTQPQRRSYQKQEPTTSKGSSVATKNTAQRKPPTAGQHMRALLRDKRGRVTIRDIFTLCEKDHGERSLLPMMNDVDDASFKGYKSITEMLDVMGVDVKKLDDCALQIYRYNNSQGDYGTYLDLESPLDEQAEELEGFQDQRKNALILRTQLSVRVHCVIEKLLNSTGRELRRALFSLKQIFQDDKDLVHEFVNNDGLDCLIKVGAEADQNYQNYILRALGQVMLYVDGMNGVIAHNSTIQWLYSLLSSRYRLVVKTALKLLLVFVEYTESNTQLLLHAVNVVDARRDAKPWTNIMNILEEKDGGDSELLVYAMTLVNKVLSAIPDQDAFYDVTDALEELGMEKVTKRHLRRKGTDLDLVTQFQIFEASLKHEDGDDNINQKQNLRRTPRIRSEEEMGRKSRRYSSGTPPNQQKLQQQPQHRPLCTQYETKPEDEYRDRKNKAREGLHLPPENTEHDKLRAPQRGMPYQDESPPQSQNISPRATQNQTSPRNRQDRQTRQKTLILELQEWQTHKRHQNQMPVVKGDSYGDANIVAAYNHSSFTSASQPSIDPPEADVIGVHGKQSCTLQEDEVPNSIKVRRQESFNRQSQHNQSMRTKMRSLEDLKKDLQNRKERRRRSAAEQPGVSTRESLNPNIPPLHGHSQQESRLNNDNGYLRTNNGFHPNAQNHVPYYQDLRLNDTSNENGHVNEQRAITQDFCVYHKDALQPTVVEMDCEVESSNIPELSARLEALPLRDTDTVSMASTSSSLSSLSAPRDPRKRTSFSSLSDVDSLDDHSMLNQRRHMFEKPTTIPDEPIRSNHRNQDSKESGYVSTDDMNSPQNRAKQVPRRNEMESRNNALNDSLNESQSDHQKWLLYRMSRPSMDEEESRFPAQAPAPAPAQPSPQPPPQPLTHTPIQKGGYNQGTPQPPPPPVQPGNVMDRYSGNTPDVKQEPQGPTGPSGDSSGMINKAKDTFTAKPGDNIATKKLKSSQPQQTNQESVQEVKKSESDILWDQLQKKLKRPLKIKNMDFSDLREEDTVNVFAPAQPMMMSNGGPPPPPPMMGGIPPPPPTMGGPPPPPPMMGGPPPPPPMGGPPPPMGGPPPPPSAPRGPPPPGANLKKNKKTLRLHWKEIQNNAPHPANGGETIWKQVVKVPIKLDIDRLEHLFESKTNEMKAKKQDPNKKEITVLDAKRSNGINIGMTKLPPPRTIKAAILKMDTTIMSKEGIEKILETMIPTDEERNKIEEAQNANPDTPLGSAEQFLQILSSVNEVEARLQLWLFKLDYENMEQEVAEPLMDLKKGIEDLIENKTFKYILTTVLAIGNFLNGASSQAFSIEYLSKVPEVKDTVHKHSLLHHLCTIVLEQFPDSTDLYSEIGPIARCAKVDWEELVKKLDKMEYQCKRSWDNLRAIAKHDGSYAVAKTRNAEFLSDAAERVMVLQMVYERVINRYSKLLLYMAIPVHQAKTTKINYFCKIISEFALEFRTTREKVLQQMLKKEKQRERKKTRGKMIMDAETYKKGVESDDALSKLLSNGYASEQDGSLPGQKARRKLGSLSGSRSCLTTDSEFDTGDDEILEACVRTATKPTNRAPRERKRARNQRKSLRRTLKGGLDEDEKEVIAAFSDVV